MHSIKFKGHTAILGVSQGYLPLAVLSTSEGGVNIHNSYWKPSPEDLALLNKGHVVHLGVLGAGQPPVMVAISNVPAADIEEPYSTDGLDNRQLTEMRALGYQFTGDETKGILSGLQDKGNVKVRLVCQVCDGTGLSQHVDSAGTEACRFCNGGYIDAAN